MSELQTSRAVLAALKGLQEKVRHLENERTQAIKDVQTLKGDLVRLQEEARHTQELKVLANQEESAAARLSYERLLADKRVVDTRLNETEGLKRELQETCESARSRGQDAHVAQLAAETKASILERRVKECEQTARARKERCSRSRKTLRRETSMAGSQLDALAGRMEMLQHTLKDERSSRKLVEAKRRGAQSTTTRINRYLDSILQVNQELVTNPGNCEPLPRPSRLSRPPANRPSTPRDFQRKELNKDTSSALRLRTTVLDEIDVGTAVVDAVLIGRAGGDPVPSLTALYERLGFCAIQGRDEDNVVPSLPTSPTRAAVDTFHEPYSFEDDEEKFLLGPEEPDISGRFSPRGGVEVLASSRQCTTSRNFDKGHTGLGGGGRTGIKGYSFAHSPIARAASVAERSPKVLRRLEALESQLERERAAMEQWYKNVVHRGIPGAQEGGDTADLDASSLSKAIACLQEKAQQLQVVRESVQAFKATPSTSTVASPTACRRKVAALHVLQGLCHDVVGGEKGNRVTAD